MSGFLDSLRNKSDEEIMDFITRACIKANKLGIEGKRITEEQIDSLIFNKIPKLGAGDVVEVHYFSNISNKSNTYRAVVVEGGYAISLNGGLVICPNFFNMYSDYIRAVYRFNPQKEKLEKIWVKE